MGYEKKMNFVDDELVHMPKGRTKQMRIPKKREPGTETLVEKIPLKAVCDDDIEKVDLGFLDNISSYHTSEEKKPPGRPRHRKIRSTTSIDWTFPPAHDLVVMTPEILQGISLGEDDREEGSSCSN